MFLGLLFFGEKSALRVDEWTLMRLLGQWQNLQVFISRQDIGFRRKLILSIL